MDEDTRNPVEVLAEEFVDRCRRGESPSIEKYVAGHPEHAEELETVLQAALLVEQLKQGSGWPASPEAEARDRMPKIERLGDYRIVREIGRGGMGVVYEAEQEALRRRVAVKVLAPMAMRSSGLVTRFRREAQAAANLHHTNIVQVYGVGEQDGLHYFVMQFVDGRGLDELATEADGGVKPRRAANIGWQVASALAHAHERGVLHRDVKPANLLLDAEGTAWITDFGLAKVLLDPGGLTEAGDIIGTVRYMPPERFEGMSDARGDVYGLGLVLYELLAGRAAFSDKDRGSLISAVREGRTRPLRDLVPEVPTDLATVVEKAIAANPDDRYQTTADVAEDLERYLEDRPIKARPIGPIARARRWCRRNKSLAVLASVAAAAVLLAAVTGWVGYLVAQGALERESEGRARAEAATKRAETNERMSLDALQDIFDSLAGSQEGPPRQGPGLPPDPRNEEDTALLQSVLAFYDRFAAENKTNPRLRRESARALVRVGTMRAQAGDGEGATKAFARAAASFEAMRAEFPEDEENVIDLARTLSESALWAVHDERPDDAKRAAERAVAELEALGDARDEVGRRGELARARCRLAFAQASRGDEARARATLALVAEGAGTRARGAGRRVDLHLEVALVYKALATHAIESNQFTRALTDLDMALTTLREGGDRPPPPQAVANIQRDRVDLLRLLGRTEEAEQAEAEAQAEGRDGLPPRGGPGQRHPPRRDR